MASSLPHTHRQALKDYAREIGGQKVLAEEFGVCRATVNRWLRGDGCEKYEEVTRYTDNLLKRRPDLGVGEEADTIQYIKEQLGCDPGQAKVIATVLMS